MAWAAETANDDQIPVICGKWAALRPEERWWLFAMTADDEMAFAMPWAEAPTVREGLEQTHRRGVSRVPTPFFGMRMEPSFPERYAELERHGGLR